MGGCLGSEYNPQCQTKEEDIDKQGSLGMKIVHQLHGRSSISEHRSSGLAAGCRKGCRRPN